MSPKSSFLINIVLADSASVLWNKNSTTCNFGSHKQVLSLLADVMVYMANLRKNDTKPVRTGYFNRIVGCKIHP